MIRMASAGGVQKCCICLDDAGSHSVCEPSDLRLGCGCLTHYDCLLSYICSQLRDKEMLLHEVGDVDPSTRIGVICPYSKVGQCKQVKYFITIHDLRRLIHYGHHHEMNDILKEEEVKKLQLWLSEPRGIEKTRMIASSGVMTTSGGANDLTLSSTNSNISSSSENLEEFKYINETTKPCPVCDFRASHFHNHGCHSISRCRNCSTTFCFKCLCSEQDNILDRGSAMACKCGAIHTFCKPIKTPRDVRLFVKFEPGRYPVDSRCGCAICPECRPGVPCGTCGGSCVVCQGIVLPGPSELGEDWIPQTPEMVLRSPKQSVHSMLIQSCTAGMLDDFVEIAADAPGEVHVNAPDAIGRTFLHYAIDGGSEPLVRYLLAEMGANPNTCDRDVNFPITMAVQSARLDLVECLVSYGARVNVQNSLRASPLHLACCCSPPDIDLIMFLVGQRGAMVDLFDDNGATPLMNLLERNSGDESFPAVVKLLLDRNCMLNFTKRSGLTLLQVFLLKIGSRLDSSASVVSHHNTDRFQALSRLEHEQRGVSGRHRHRGANRVRGETSEAEKARILLCRTLVFKILLAAGADPWFDGGAERGSCLHLAAHLGLAEIVQSIIESIPSSLSSSQHDQKLLSLDAMSRTALSHAAEMGCVEVCQVLLRACRDPRSCAALLSSADIWGCMPLHHVALKLNSRKSFDTLKLLVSEGADINAFIKDYSGYVPPPNLRVDFGGGGGGGAGTHTMLAYSNDLVRIGGVPIHFLLDGFTKPKPDPMPLALTMQRFGGGAAGFGGFGAFGQRRHEINEVLNGVTNQPTEVVAHSQQSNDDDYYGAKREAFQFLVDNGVNLTICDGLRRSVLHLASASEEAITLLPALLDRIVVNVPASVAARNDGFNLTIDAPDAFGLTALHHAVKAGNLGAASLLLQHGCSLDTVFYDPTPAKAAATDHHPPFGAPMQLWPGGFGFRGGGGDGGGGGTEFYVRRDCRRLSIISEAARLLSASASGPRGSGSCPGSDSGLLASTSASALLKLLVSAGASVNHACEQHGAALTPLLILCCSLAYGPSLGDFVVQERGMKAKEHALVNGGSLNCVGGGGGFGASPAFGGPGRNAARTDMDSDTLADENGNVDGDRGRGRYRDDDSDDRQGSKSSSSSTKSTLQPRRGKTVSLDTQTASSLSLGLGPGSAASMLVSEVRPCSTTSVVQVCLQALKDGADASGQHIDADATTGLSLPVGLLLSKFPTSGHSKIDFSERQWTALHFASALQAHHTVEFLIKGLGASVNCRSADGTTPLMLATAALGGDPFRPDMSTGGSSHATSLVPPATAAMPRRKLALTRMGFINSTAGNLRNGTGMFGDGFSGFGAEQFMPPPVPNLLARRVDGTLPPGPALGSGSGSGSSTIAAMAISAAVTAASAVFRAADSDNEDEDEDDRGGNNGKDDQKAFPLSLHDEKTKTLKGSSTTLRILLSAGCDVNLRDAQGRTALIHSVLHGNAAAVRALLAVEGAELEAQELPLAPATVIAAADDGDVVDYRSVRGTTKGPPKTVLLSTHPHPLSRTLREHWNCDGQGLTGGCCTLAATATATATATTGSRYAQPPPILSTKVFSNQVSWYCPECDFDLCQPCVLQSSGQTQLLAHTGFMLCLCVYALGQATWPLNSAVRHTQTCRWQCCQESWNKVDCTAGQPPPTLPQGVAAHEHTFTIGLCHVCRHCSKCSGYGDLCQVAAGRDRTADKGRPCGCGGGDRGCSTCGLCQICCSKMEKSTSLSQSSPARQGVARLVKRLRLHCPGLTLSVRRYAFHPNNLDFDSDPNPQAKNPEVGRLCSGFVFDVLVEPALQESTGCYRLANGTGYVPSAQPNYFLEEIEVDMEDANVAISLSPTGGFSALHHASRAGRLDLVSMLVCASKRSSSISSSSSSSSSSNGSLSTRGASLSSLRDARKRTALQLAVETLSETVSSGTPSSRRESRHPDLFSFAAGKSWEPRVGGAQTRGLDDNLVIGLKKVIDFLADFENV